MSVQAWLQSADVLVSLLLDSMGNTDYMEDWDLCLRLLENLSLDLLGQVQCLLEDRVVCAQFLGSLYRPDSLVNSACVDGESCASLTGYM
ncbi:unnamed protein product [Leuciscus chuanchicus]